MYDEYGFKNRMLLKEIFLKYLRVQRRKFVLIGLAGE